MSGAGEDDDKEMVSDIEGVQSRVVERCQDP